MTTQYDAFKVVVDIHEGRAVDGVSFEFDQSYEAGLWLANELRLMERLNALPAEQKRLVARTLLRHISTRPGVLRHNWYMCGYTQPDGSDVVAPSIRDLMHIWTRVDGKDSVGRWKRRHLRPIMLELCSMPIYDVPLYGLDLALMMWEGSPDHPVHCFKPVIERARAQADNIELEDLADALYAEVNRMDMSRKDKLSGFVRACARMAFMDDAPGIVINRHGYPVWGDMGAVEFEMEPDMDQQARPKDQYLHALFRYLPRSGAFDVTEATYHDEVLTLGAQQIKYLERAALEKVLMGQ